MRAKGAKGSALAPRSFFIRCLETWLDHNRHRFNHPPQVLKRRPSGLILGFDSVNPMITCWAQGSGDFMPQVEHEGDLWDSLTWDFDCYAQRHGHGYVCGLCLESGHKKLYPTREALWIEHSFEPWLKWCNRMFTKNRRLCLFRWPLEKPGICSAKLVHSRRFTEARGRDDFLSAHPVLIST